ncbi:uncharacterized protein K02A2.6-like isoform X1 [Photinus pyralis]|uniref:uncharacterized protein K02A2.6-like isoform X1 n=2 Tax=Photinus pyralis TaxID=7054 RepID=UPI0012676C48|nr:uncharacterized protein K02A2.6-like isoform X1 [Photinus pyralis]
MAVVGTMPVFDCNEDFVIFKERIVQFFKANSIAEAKQVPVLITALSSSVYTTLRDLCYPDKPDTKTFAEICKLLAQQYSKAISIFNERRIFYKMQQSEGEQINDWFARVKKLAVNCKFGADLTMVLKDKFVTGMVDGKVLDRLVEEDPSQKTLDELFQMAVKKEASLRISGGSSRQQLFAIDKKRVTERRAERGPQHKVHSAKASGSQSQVKCYACGKKNHNFSKCTYKNFKCRLCFKVGHITSICNMKRQNYLQSRDEAQSHVEIQNEDSVLERTLYHLDNEVTHNFKVDVFINRVRLRMEIDTGSAISVSRTVLKSYDGTNIYPKGKINVSLQIGGDCKMVELLVIDNGGNPLLGRDLLARFNVSMCSKNVFVLNDCKDSLDVLVNNYAELFKDELGHFKFEKVKLEVVEGTTPKFHKPRNLPIAYKGLVEVELDRLQKEGVITPVPDSVWGTPLVPILKKDGTIRLCADYKVTVNNYLKDVKYPLPLIENLFAALQGGEKFSKLDLSHAYNQLELEESTKLLLAWSTHKGIFKVERLPFGTKPACSIFQHIMEKVLQGVTGVTVFLDDIVVTGRNNKEHLQNLEVVFQKLKGAGFRLNRVKCNFLQDRIEYLGHIISKEGLQKNPSKIKAIVNCPRPENVSQVKAFIGMINYYAKFISNVTKLLNPLYKLLSKDSVFAWSRECENSFITVKEVMASDIILVHFDPKLPIKVSCDASSYGVAGILAHVFPDGSERPIEYASRKLTTAEMNYAVIDKEALAIYFSINKFSNYLFGHKFVLVTDHKPLKYLFGDTRSIPVTAAGRLQRWAVYLSGFDYSIEYVEGKRNSNADGLSRLPINLILKESTEYTYLNFVAQNSDIVVDAKAIEEETKIDKIYSKIFKFVKDGWPTQNTDKDLQRFFNRRFEFSIEQEVIMLGHRVVVPTKFHDSILNELHITHAGIVKMKSIARSYVWWPLIDADIERVAKQCVICNKFKPNPPLAEVLAYKQAKQVFERIHVDFFGPVRNKMFLVVLDACSRWPEVIEMCSTTSLATIEALRSIFARYGLPDQLVSDNGPQFRSYEFENFCRNNGIKHTLTPPFHPASNGAAENAVKAVKTALIKAFSDGRNSNISTSCLLARYLLNYRAADHGTTNKSPASIMFGRELKLRLSNVRPKYKTDSEELTICKPGRAISFEQGEDVYIRDYSNINKKSWIPAKIHKVLGPRVYLCKNSKGMYKRHLDQILRSIPTTTTDNKPLISTNCSDNFKYTIVPLHDNTVSGSEVNVAQTNIQINNPVLTHAHSRPVRVRKKPDRLDL